MAESKAGLAVRDVIVQEGVYTFERVGDEVAGLVHDRPPTWSAATARTPAASATRT